MALEHVRVALVDDPGTFEQELTLGHLLAGQHGDQPARVRERNGDDPVGLPRRVGKLESGCRRHLDVHRHSMQILERHAEERCLAGPEQELMRRVGEEAIRGVGSPGGSA